MIYQNLLGDSILNSLLVNSSEINVVTSSTCCWSHSIVLRMVARRMRRLVTMMMWVSMTIRTWHWLVP